MAGPDTGLDLATEGKRSRPTGLRDAKTRTKKSARASAGRGFELC